LVEDKPISIGQVAHILGMSSKKLHRWYKEVLSGFIQAQESGELNKDNIQVIEKGETINISVPIFKESNLGEQMAVDEKTINGTCYTIISNRQNGKIVLMADTLKTEYLMKIIHNIDIEKRMAVKSLSRDMASNYDWLGRQAFMNAYHVADKFHVVKQILEQLQACRIYYRQIELSRRREYKDNNKIYKETILNNGDTVLQLLARSRGLLFLFPQQWSEQQKQRARVLFKHFPEIEKAYRAVIKIRIWYKPTIAKTSYKKTRDQKRIQIQIIIKDLIKSGIDELKNIAFMIKKNLNPILHYFIAKESNAKAEALNRNLQRFVNMNYGARNMQFFLFRIKNYFA